MYRKQRKHDSTDDSNKLNQISKQGSVKGKGHSHRTVHPRSLEVRRVRWSGLEHIWIEAPSESYRLSMDPWSTVYFMQSDRQTGPSVFQLKVHYGWTIYIPSAGSFSVDHPFFHLQIIWFCGTGTIARILNKTDKVFSVSMRAVRVTKTVHKTLLGSFLCLSITRPCAVISMTIQ